MSHLTTIYAVWDHNAEAMASDIGEPGVKVRQWRNRGNIPPDYWERIIVAAKKKGVSLKLRQFLRSITIDDGEPGTWKDVISHSPNLRVEDYVPKGEAAPATADPAAGHAAPGWALSDAELDTLARDAAAEPVRVIICDVCDQDVCHEGICKLADCPFSDQRWAA